MLQNGRAIRSSLRVLLAALVAAPLSFSASSNANAQSIEVSGSVVATSSPQTTNSADIGRTTTTQAPS